MTIPLEENPDQMADTTIPFEAVTIIHTNSNTMSQNSFSMPLFNVTYDIVCTDTVHHEPILTSVRTLDVRSIVEAPYATIDPTLQKEMNFMQSWLNKAVETDVPFSPVISKSQKKKLNKLKAGYQTCSQGSIPLSK